MLLACGDLVFIAHRRLYENDQPRFFAGVVDAYDAGVLKATGYAWIRESVRGELRRKSDRRTKVVSIASVGLLIYQLPAGVDIEHLELNIGRDHTVILTDNAGFSMDLTDRNSAARLGSAA